ncbi:MAG: alpha/beta fold hydrolase [Phycisphaeraceae bacterium]|nr:alpha/beta fold hydrolase [Phycisphaeraceae bacterium]
MKRTTRTALALIGCLCTTGCSAAAFVEAPNRGLRIDPARDPGPLCLSLLGVDRQFRIRSEPENASLRVWVMEPAGHRPPRGTVFVLHGYRNGMFWQLPNGRLFARRGFRVVLTDLRGHGRSTGDWIGYGALESQDMVRVLDELKRRQLVAGRIGVWGFSMGGATAIQWAGRDKRIEAVVAVAPFASMKDIVAHESHRRSLGLAGVDSEAQLESLLRQATEGKGYRPEEADTAAAARRTRAPILIVHGMWDQINPLEQSRRILKDAPRGSRLIAIPGLGHVTIQFHNPAMCRQIPAWFETHLASSP